MNVMTTSTHGIQLADVTRHFDNPIKRALTGGTPALDHVNATLPFGRVYGLIGRNGAGKTTLLRAMAGQLRVKGEVTYDGAPVWDNQQVLDGIILSGPDVPWPTDYKVKKLLAITAARWSTWDQGLAEQLIEDFELDTNRNLSSMSRGQKSLVSIVIGLAAQCSVTLLDEPYLGLDVQNREMFYRHLLADVERNPRTFIISTHHIDDAARVLDSVILIDRGHITGVSDLQGLTERIVLLSGSSTALSAQLRDLEVDPSSLLFDATAGGTRRVTLDLATAFPHASKSAAALAQYLEGTGVRMHLADLEKAVLALTGRDIHAEEGGAR